MMPIKHHLTNDLLMRYSSGQLTEASNLAVAAHISMCDDCRAALAGFDALGGAVLEASSSETLSQESLSHTMSLIKNGPAAKRPHYTPGEVPAPLQDYIGSSLDDISWRVAGLGVKQTILKTSRNATARLLKIDPGIAVPDHGHNGEELTLVLRGSFHDEGGSFGRGDIEVADESVEHTPIADTKTGCICLAVTDAPLRFKSFVPRLLQPLFRI